MLNGYITTQEAAQKWNISARQVQILCKNNRIGGAAQINRIWLIPTGVRKPTNVTKITLNEQIQKIDKAPL